MELESTEHVDQVIGQYRNFINPGLAKLMSFAGFGDVEECAEGSTITTASAS